MSSTTNQATTPTAKAAENMLESKIDESEVVRPHASELYADGKQPLEKKRAIAIEGSACKALDSVMRDLTDVMNQVSATSF
jgi:hypothetical protein